MKIPIFTTIAVALSSSALAQPVSVAPWMTGQRLVALQHTPGVVRPDQLTAAQYTDDQRAESYMDGVHDATEGKSWCYSYEYKPKPDTMKTQVIEALRAMSAGQLKRNAADLIVEFLSAKYPCSIRSKP